MKQLIALIAMAFASATFAADAQPAKQPDTAKKVEKKKEEKVKAPPSATKPTPKKKVEAK
jgi:Ni/Co efflux regulator RcnB